MSPTSSAYPTWAERVSSVLASQYRFLKLAPRSLLILLLDTVRFNNAPRSRCALRCALVFGCFVAPAASLEEPSSLFWPRLHDSYVPSVFHTLMHADPTGIVSPMPNLPPLPPRFHPHSRGKTWDGSSSASCSCSTRCVTPAQEGEQKNTSHAACHKNREGLPGADQQQQQKGVFIRGADRRALQNLRVVRRTLVYAIGLSPNFAQVNTLKQVNRTEQKRSSSRSWCAQRRIFRPSVRRSPRPLGMVRLVQG